MPDINDIVDQQRADLARRDVRLLNQISADYQRIVDRIVAELDVLQRKIDKAQAAGEDISPSWLFREQRLKDLISQAGREFDRFSITATAETSKEQLVQVRISERHLFEQGSAELAGADLELGLTFNRLSTRAVEALVGRASDGSPLKDLFDKLGPAFGQSVRDELIQAVALGQGPAVTARRIKDILGGNEARAQLIARTETIQAYREGAHQTSIENSDILDGWTWVSTLDGRGCAACIALNGTFHKLDERMAAHPACRCTKRFETKSFAELGVAGVGETRAAPIEAGASWFANVSRETQELILGKKGAKAYAAGDVQLTNFVGLRTDARWGPSYFQRSVKDALEGPQPGVELEYPPASIPTSNTPPSSSTPGPSTPAPLTAEEARIEIKRLSDEYTNLLDQAKRDLTRELDQLAMRTDIDTATRFRLNRDITQANRTLTTSLTLELEQKRLAALSVADPIDFRVTFESRFDRVRQIRNRNGIEGFKRLVSAKVQPPPGDDFVEVHASRKRRSFQKVRTVNIAKKADSSIVVHELGHWLEEWSPGLHDKILKFYDARTSGESLLQLRTVMNDKRYAAHEVTKIDKFLRAYMGRWYFYGGRQYATEILSMGLELFYSDPLQLIEADPDYFDFIYNLVRGQ